MHRKTNQAIKELIIQKYNSGALQTVSDNVIVEEKILCEIDGSSFELLATPNDLEALLLGFLYSKGLIAVATDCVISQTAELAFKVGWVKRAYNAREPNMNLLKKEEGGTHLKKVGRNFGTISCETLFAVMQKLFAAQKLFTQTGATHAALIFDVFGNEIAFAEDIARHNALDKAIGKVLLAGKKTAGLAVALSSRVSYVMAEKAMCAGFELISAVSAPSSLAVSLAEKAGLTLCGFVRQKRCNIYSNPCRISNLNE